MHPMQVLRTIHHSSQMFSTSSPGTFRELQPAQIMEKKNIEFLQLLFFLLRSELIFAITVLPG